MNNKYKVGYIITTIFDYLLTFGGPLSIIVVNYVDEQSSTAYKISLTGIIMVVALLFSCKAIFEHTYQNKQNALLQQLATADDQLIKEEINKKINAHRMANSVYQRLMVVLPFAILYVVTKLGAETLAEMNGTVGMITMFLVGGSALDVAREPLKDKADKLSVQNKVAKRN